MSWRGHSETANLMNLKVGEESQPRNLRRPRSWRASRTFQFSKECAELKTLCGEMAQQLVTLFEKKRPKLERAFRRTGLADQGWEFSDITQCLFAVMYRGARDQLEQRGFLTPRQKHSNGAEWIFWAEESDS